MRSVCLCCLSLAFVVGAALAQDTETAVDEPSAEVLATNEADAESAEVEVEAELDEIDDADLDLQTYEQDDDEFVPTEEVPADQAIPFPSDI